MREHCSTVVWQRDKVAAFSRKPQHSSTQNDGPTYE